MALINGTSGDDFRFGTVRDDRMFGFGGNDYLYGGAARDVLYGGNGNDTLEGGPGYDTLFGEAGRDLLIGGPDRDYLDGGPGLDVAQFSGKSTDYRISKISKDSYFVADQRQGRDNTDELKSIERLYFPENNVTIYLVANNGPVAINDFANGTEDTFSLLGGNVLVNDSDPDLDPIYVSAVRTGPQAGSGTGGSIGFALTGLYGSLTLQSNGTYSYDIDNYATSVNGLNAGDTVTDFFTYTLADGASTSQATLSIAISGANDAPVGEDDYGTATEGAGAGEEWWPIEDASVNIQGEDDSGMDAVGNVLTNDYDVDFNTVLVVSAVRTGQENDIYATLAGTVGTPLQGDHGSLDLEANGDYRYVVDNSDPEVDALNPGESLYDYFTYTVADGDGGYDDAELRIEIQGEDDPATAVDDTDSTDEDTPVTIDVLANDTDVDNSYIDSVSIPQNGGTAEIVDGQIVYTPGEAFQYLSDGEDASDTFTYDTDGTTGTVTVTITGVNDDPVAVPDTATAIWGSPPGASASGDVLANDTDVDSSPPFSVTAVNAGTAIGEGPPGTVNGSTAGMYGFLTLNSDGTYDYDVDTENADVIARMIGEDLTDTFSYEVADGDGGTDTTTLTITIDGSLLVTFDDIVTPANGVATLDSPYQGFTWAGLAVPPEAPGYGVVNANDYVNNPSGYQQGVVSPENVAYGQVELSFSRPTPFDFESGYFTAPWKDDATLIISGFLGGNQVTPTYVYIGVLDSQSSYFLALPSEFDYVDKVVLEVSGGTPHAGYAFGLDYVAVDNLSFLV